MMSYGVYLDLQTNDGVQNVSDFDYKVLHTYKPLVIRIQIAQDPYTNLS